MFTQQGTVPKLPVPVEHCNKILKSEQNHKICVDAHMPLLQVAFYTRTSCQANANKSGPARQEKAVQGICPHQSFKVAKSLTEVVSGSLPMDKRKAFTSFLAECSKSGIEEILVESTRAVARDASVAESLFQMSKSLGVKIVPADIPSLYEHSPNPAQKFLRRVMMAYTELEKDLTVQRLQAGLALKRQAVTKALKTKQTKIGNKIVFRNQRGHAKANGRMSILQHMKLEGTLTKQKLNRLKMAVSKFHQNGSLKGKTGLQTSIRNILCRPDVGHETARRMAKEIQYL